MTKTERTLVLIKPDAVDRGVIGAIISRYEGKGLVVRALELRQIDSACARAHYGEHVTREYYPSLESFITSGPLVCMVVEGERAITAVRALNGATDPVVAAPGTIRGDFALSTQSNVVHSSDSADSASREIALWFPGRGLDV